MGMVSKPLARLRRLVRVISLPAKQKVDPKGILIQPYRGYGSRSEIFLMGRVFRQHHRSTSSKETLRDDLAYIARRLFRHGLAGVRLEARLNGTRRQVVSDRDGYFRIHMRLDRPFSASPTAMWHNVPISLVRPGHAPITARGEILVPPVTARFLVISDIDDTIIFTGVANKLKMLVRLFLHGARSRVAFPGAAALYRALHHGASQTEMNPLLYVSRGPWGIYEILDEFFNMHQIPIGPILFLREWGLRLRRPFPRRSKGHKITLIRKMLSLYHDLPCVLIGDSGQHDPEIYARMVREYPGRIRAVYIRNVSHSTERLDAIEALAGEIAAQGSALVLAADSFAMAEHMAQDGLISGQALGEVLAERMAQENETNRRQTRYVTGSSPNQTRRAVEQGALKRKLEDMASEGDSPPNVVVESESGKEPL